MTDVDDCCWLVFRLDQTEKVLRLVASRGVHDTLALDERTFPVGAEGGLIGMVAATERALTVPDVHVEPRWLPLDRVVDAAYLAPMVLHGRVTGVFVLAKRGPIDALHRALVDALWQQYAIAWSVAAEVDTAHAALPDTSQLATN